MSGTASVLLHIVSEAHKTKPDLYQVCLQQQLLSQSFPFFCHSIPAVLPEVTGE